MLPLWPDSVGPSPCPAACPWPSLSAPAAVLKTSGDFFSRTLFKESYSTPVEMKHGVLLLLLVAVQSTLQSLTYRFPFFALQSEPNPGWQGSRPGLQTMTGPRTREWSICIWLKRGMLFIASFQRSCRDCGYPSTPLHFLFYHKTVLSKHG